ncbi:MAG TPA: flagellar biosynthetic protein FliQ [Candidatus Eremiobacteraeota bacterium]|nr:flagellar biosynthetic protein FliQ [Candidatus Eremiobacteraeota bacterium]
MTIEWIALVSKETFALIVHLAWPMLVSAILVGMIIAIFQAATQVQEQSLSFVPKILITFYVVYQRGPYIWQRIMGFLHNRLEDTIWLAASYKNAVPHIVYVYSIPEVRLSQRDMIAIGGKALYMIYLISAPMLFFALGVGLVISVLQAVSSVQEQTLGFVPKLLVTFITLLMFGPWIMSTMKAFTVDTWRTIVTIGHG